MVSIIRKPPLCSISTCDRHAVEGDTFCDYHLPMIERAYEIKHQPAAEDIAAETVRALYEYNDGKCYPPRRPEDDGRWA